MEAGVSAMARMTQVNGSITPSTKEKDELYTQLLKLRDLVVAGRHPRFKLPPAVVEELKTDPVHPDAVENVARLATDGGVHSVTDRQHPSQTSTLPGLRADSTSLNNGRGQGYAGKTGAPAELNPIFLEKSDSLVRAEGQLKRQRLERDLQMQVDLRKHSSRDKDPSTDAPSAIDVDGILSTALQRIRPVSGLKPVATAHSDTSSVFDENDYYSSQVQTDWSSDAGSIKGADAAPAVFTAEFERLDGAVVTLRSPVELKQASAVDAARLADPQALAGAAVQDSDDSFRPDEEEDEYSPPDATAIDSSRQDVTDRRKDPHTSADDDNSEYEPGELTTDSNDPELQKIVGQNGTQTSPAVPVFRNQLTHMAAPQPSRISPLATAKAPSAQLELVNGRPEVVQMPSNKRSRVQSRPSTASPSGNNTNIGRKKARKKRRREAEAAGGTKKQRKQQQAAAHLLHQQNRFIKHEPSTPPSRATVHSQHVPQSHYFPVENDLRPPHYGVPIQVTNPHAAPELQLQHVPQLQYSVVRSGSAASYRPARTDNQDIRRVTSLQHAQRPISPVHQGNSPVALSHSASALDRHSRTLQPEQVRYMEQPRTPSPPRFQEYVESYRPQETRHSLMLPPPPPARLVEDQFGHLYYPAKPELTQHYIRRESLAPVERTSREDLAYERAPSHASAFQTKDARPTVHYERVKETPTAVPQYRKYLTEHSTTSLDRNDARTYTAQGYSAIPLEPDRSMESAHSPAITSIPSYRPMPPPPAPLAQDYMPSEYHQMSRSHSVLPMDPRPMYGTYSRQGSIVSGPQTQTLPQPRPVRASSVMPSRDFGGGIPASVMYGQVPQLMRYVDEYGNEVFPHQVRQLY